MQLFVTGGAGFIGSQFVRSWLQLRPQDRLVNYDKLTYAGNLDNLAGMETYSGYRFVQGDICDPEAVRDALPSQCDALVHFAAESHVDRSILGAAEFVRTNVLGTQVLLDAAREKKTARFVYVSTDEVGGDLKPGEWFREDSPLQPSSPYSASKAGGEHLVRAAARTFGMDVLITRTSNNYGPYQFPEKLIPLAITNAMEDLPVPVYGDGKQERDWIHVEDNCRGIREVLLKGRSGDTYHLGGGSPVANIELLRLLLRIMGKPESLLTFVKDRPGHDRRYAMDFSKIRKELGWVPRIGLEEGLRSTVRWYEENAEWVRRAKSGAYREYYAKWYGR